jgi:type II secretory pathway pseudopilin PulG
MTRPGNAAKNIVILIATLAILGVAGTIAYTRLSEASALNKENELREQGGTFRQKMSRELNKDPRFNRINIIVETVAEPKPSGQIVIEGSVNDEEELKYVKGLAEQCQPPYEVVFKLKVVPMPKG